MEEAEVGVVVDFRMAESAYGPAAFCEIGDGGDFGETKVVGSAGAAQRCSPRDGRR